MAQPLDAEVVKARLLAAGIRPVHVERIDQRAEPTIVVFLHGPAGNSDLALELVRGIEGVASAGYAKGHTSRTILHLIVRQ